MIWYKRSSSGGDVFYRQYLCRSPTDLYIIVVLVPFFWLLYVRVYVRTYIRITRMYGIISDVCTKYFSTSYTHTSSIIIIVEEVVIGEGGVERSMIIMYYLQKNHRTKRKEEEEHAYIHSSGGGGGRPGRIARSR